jgi:hypothetical protein
VDKGSYVVDKWRFIRGSSRGGRLGVGPAPPPSFLQRPYVGAGPLDGNLLVRVAGKREAPGVGRGL